MVPAWECSLGSRSSKSRIAATWKGRFWVNSSTFHGEGACLDIYIYIHRCHPQIHYHFGFRSTIKLHNTATVCLKTSGMRLFVSLENIPYQDKPWGFGGFFWLVKKVRVIELMNQPGCFLRSPCESALLLNLLSSLKFLYPRKMNPITTIPHETNDLTLIDTL